MRGSPRIVSILLLAGQLTFVSLPASDDLMETVCCVDVLALINTYSIQQKCT